MYHLRLGNEGPKCGTHQPSLASSAVPFIILSLSGGPLLHRTPFLTCSLKSPHGGRGCEVLSAPTRGGKVSVGLSVHQGPRGLARTLRQPRCPVSQEPGSLALARAWEEPLAGRTLG